MLGQQRLPLLDLEALKGEFIRISAEAHPDKAGAKRKAEAEGRFAELNAAYKTLGQTRSRLMHLLELEGVPPAPHVQSVPGEVMEFFGPMGEITRGVDEFLERKRRASSPILQAQLFEEGLGWTERIQEVLGRVRERIKGLEEELGGMNAVWEKAGWAGEGERREKLPLRRVEEIAGALGFLERWRGQLEERLTPLAF